METNEQSGQIGQSNRQQIDEAYRQYNRKMLISMVMGQLNADGVLIVGVNEDPEKEGRYYVDTLLEENVATGVLMGIIPQLMATVNQRFTEAELDPPYPDVRQFIRKIPPAEV
jgi:hypothetical protein